MPTDFAIFPSAEKLAVHILKDARDIDHIFDDIGVSPHIAVKAPVSPDYLQGVIKVARVGGRPTDRRWLDHPDIQLDTWAETKQLAHDISQRARVALMRAEGKTYTNPDCVVTGTEDGVGLAWDFDPVNLKPRYTVSVYMSIHL